MWDWYVTNSTLIKDTFWIIFTLVTTITAVLTYRRARKTLLQPLRSEVVKRQTDILVQLIGFLGEDVGALFSRIDYVGIIHSNIYMFSQACGFFTEQRNTSDDEFNAQMQAAIGGYLIVKPNKELESLQIVTPFGKTEKVSEREIERIRQDRRVLYKNGVFDNEYLLLTRKFQEFMHELNLYIENPFMPEKIVKLLRELETDIFKNIRNPLQEEVQGFMSEMCLKMSELTENRPIEFNPIGVMNNFTLRSKSHQDLLKRVRKYIREYLLVDKEW